ncbi:cell division protein FtsZ [Erwinia pyrifoliae]|uniref:Cell division protein FtsZ n=1 Tax=Erwinia pyrifoliae TaxID=79967 RepID=A0ABY5XDJ0_ERWPY|nr:cell division protein FtsZ [Erwinia pyrifoliae]MCT2387120.1 cell division protein FtsZ [Erwinia pyrifoliae]MCU8587280.1 cell division protein FtsZ [Erwinia pyrifoliae]UWS35063.1 cell division protein FtsZ [Erwinia pyrifoliae]
MYGTAFMPRHAVVPGTMIKHKGKYWRSSANLEKGLYTLTSSEVTRINSDTIEVILNQRGLPLIN